MVDPRSSMRRAAMLLAAASLFSMLARTASAAETVTLAGRVVGPEGKPISDAGVLIAGVAAREGESLLSRYSHIDCLKHAFTDANGRFTIPGLAGDVKFTVVVASAGLKRALIENVIPEEQPLEVKLAPTKLKLVRSQANDVRGQVLLPDGSPAAGAIVVPRGYMQGDTGLEGPMDKVAESTVADREGRFTIGSTEHVTALHLEVATRGAVRQFFMDVPSGAYESKLELVQGVTARGRVMQDDKPAAGIVVGAIWTKHHSGCYFGPWDTVTDAEGRFVLENLTPDEDLCVFGHMKSLEDRGALAAVPLHGADGEVIELGNLEVKPGYELSGWLQMTDGATLPENTRVCITRALTRDQIEVPARSDGFFEVKHLPAELVNLYVWQRQSRSDNPRNLVRFTDNNLSKNPTMFNQLRGRIESDHEVLIGLERKRPTMPEQPQTAAEVEWLSGVVERLEHTQLHGLPGAGLE